MIASIASMLFVLGALAGLLWWLHRVAGRNAVSGRHVQVIESVALGPGRSLHLVRLAGRGLLIAASSQGCDLICELESLPPEPPAGETPSWVEALRARTGRSG